MEPIEQVTEWLFWHHAVEYIKHDLQKVESAQELRFPFIAGWIVRQVGSRAYAKEQELLRQLKASGIRIVKEKADKGELFVIWAHRGNTDLYRIPLGKLRSEAQKKVDEVMQAILPIQDPPSSQEG